MAIALVILSGVGDGSRSGRLRTPANITRGTRFERTAFHQGIAPAAQSGDVDVDPVIPPVERFRIETENGTFGLGEGRLFHAEFFREAVDAGDYGLLHGNGEPFVALLGNRNGFKFQLQPMLNSLLRA